MLCQYAPPFLPAPIWPPLYHCIKESYTLGFCICGINGKNAGLGIPRGVPITVHAWGQQTQLVSHKRSLGFIDTLWKRDILPTSETTVKTSYEKGTYYPHQRPLWRLHGDIYWAPTCNKALRTWFLLNIDHLAHSSTSNLSRIDGCKKMFRNRQDMRTITREWNIKDTVQ